MAIQNNQLRANGTWINDVRANTDTSVDYVKWNNDIIWTRPPPTPAAPSYNNSPVNNATVTISWTKVARATGYRVEYYRGSWTLFQNLGDVDSTTWTANGASIYFRVIAKNAGGESSASANGGILNVDPPTAGTPTYALTGNTNSTIRISWAAVARATSYELQFQANNSGTWVNWVTGITNAYYDWQSAFAGSYRFRVRGRSATGVGSYGPAGGWSVIVPAFNLADNINNVNSTGSGTQNSVQVFKANGSASSGSWGTPSTTNAGANYDIKYTYVGSTQPGGSGMNPNTWYNLGTDRSFNVTAFYFQGPMSRSSTISYQIRPAGGGSQHHDW